MTKSCGNIRGGLKNGDSTEMKLYLISVLLILHLEIHEVHETLKSRSHIDFPLMNIGFSHVSGIVEGPWFGHPEG